MRQTEDQQAKLSRKRRIKKAIRTFFLDDVSSTFITWVRRFLIGIWLFIIFITAPGFIQSWNKITSSFPPGEARNGAFCALVKDTVLVVVVFPGVFYMALGYGINPQSAFLNSQFGTTFHNIGFRIKKNKKKKKSE